MSDAKEAIRSAAVGQDFGADTAAFDPNAPVTEAVEQDHRGSLMKEFESYERIVEGLKKASDGARHVATHASPDLWNKLAELMDLYRRNVVRESGFGRMEDGRASLAVFGGDTLNPTEAKTRIATGLRDAEAGANQIAICQRMNGRWLTYANHFNKIARSVREIALRQSRNAVMAQWGGGTAEMQ